MNRREAIAALASLPGLARIERADLKPTDVLVVSVDAYISEDVAAQIKETLALVWPGTKAVVLEKGMTLKVVSQ